MRAMQTAANTCSAPGLRHQVIESLLQHVLGVSADKYKLRRQQEEAKEEEEEVVVRLW